MQKYYNYINNMKFQSSKTVWFTIKYIKKTKTDVHNVKYTLSVTYFYPKFIKIEI